MNLELAAHILNELRARGVREVCVCPGARNAPWVALLSAQFNSCQDFGGEPFQSYFFFEERSAAFFALGRIKTTQRPVAVVTTSGTAVGELLPATMEAYYSGLPLVLLTADRPRNYRGSGAPQAAEQVGLFGIYVSSSIDVEGLERPDLSSVCFNQPIHVNVCFDEPLLNPAVEVNWRPFGTPRFGLDSSRENLEISEFLQKSKNPLVIVGMLDSDDYEAVIQLLLRWKIPAYFEAISGLREEVQLDPVRIHGSDRVMEHAMQGDYPVDGFVRIGGVPTLRLWRDLESKYSHLPVLSLSSLPFSGLGRSSFFVRGALRALCQEVEAKLSQKKIHGPEHSCQRLLELDRMKLRELQSLLLSEPLSEPGMIAALSRIISKRSQVYLGNSLPIREWDLAATFEDRRFHVWASRGLNGIDGQVSTFFGFARADLQNWAFIGDLTALYDLPAPWILSQMADTPIRIGVINNGGGKIFSRLFPQQQFQNQHQLRFESWAKLWSLPYEQWTRIPQEWDKSQKKGEETAQETAKAQSDHKLIEILPSEALTQRFWKNYLTL